MIRREFYSGYYQVNRYVTLKEICNNELPLIANPTSLATRLSALTPAVSATISLFQEALFQKLYARHYNDYCIVVEDEEVTDGDIRSFWIKLVNRMQLTAPKYEELLKDYTALDGHLLDKIKTSTSTTTDFSDTPQSTDEVEGTEFISTKTKSSGVSESDGLTPVARLHEIAANFDNILEKWIREFDILFIEEV